MFLKDRWKKEEKVPDDPGGPRMSFKKRGAEKAGKGRKRPEFSQAFYFFRSSSLVWKLIDIQGGLRDTGAREGLAPGRDIALRFPARVQKRAERTAAAYIDCL